MYPYINLLRKLIVSGDEDKISRIVLASDSRYKETLLIGKYHREVYWFEIAWSP
jgi:hypothetical protein